MNFAELGIAPGLHTIRIARHTGAVPHGFDFANAGVEQTKRNFSAAGFSPDNVHLLDVTASNVSTTHSDRYDVVYSNGLVEHFVDVTPVLANHASFVRSGGTVAVIVPNLVFVRALVPPDLQAIHNFAIMSPEALIASLPPNLTPIEAGYLGGIADLGLFVARNRLVNAFRLAGYLLQRLTIDIAQRALLKVGVDLSNRWFSPGVYVVARKV